jgi:polyisoprenoid-binding protein YceI
MKTRLAHAVAAAVLACAATAHPPAAASEWRVDPAGSRLGFSGT